MLSEYNPREIKVNMQNRTAIVVMNSKKDVQDFLKKYNEFITCNYPRFMFSLPIPNMVAYQTQQPENMQKFSK